MQKVKTMVTEVLLSVTNEEIEKICSSVYNKCQRHHNKGRRLTHCSRSDSSIEYYCSCLEWYKYMTKRLLVLSSQAMSDSTFPLGGPGTALTLITVPITTCCAVHVHEPSLVTVCMQYKFCQLGVNTSHHLLHFSLELAFCCTVALG